MPTREQVLRALEQGLGYPEIGRLQGIPAGQAYMIATGLPADGGDVPGGAHSRPGALSTSQHLVNPPFENPTHKETVTEWIRRRVAADSQMRAAAERR